MDEKIYQIAEQIVQLHQKAYEAYLPLVEDVCNRIVSEDELSHLYQEMWEDEDSCSTELFDEEEDKMF
ncbi:hypothetical protein D3Z45_19455 [Lachnospiraceae bacterium]|nr:hypothetical protein [Lachnospiraceae bacterium]